MSDRWLEQEEIARAIHSINGALDILERYSERIKIMDAGDLAKCRERMKRVLGNAA